MKTTVLKVVGPEESIFLIRFSRDLEGRTAYDNELRLERDNFLSSFKVRV